MKPHLTIFVAMTVSLLVGVVCCKLFWPSVVYQEMLVKEPAAEVNTMQEVIKEPSVGENPQTYPPPATKADTAQRIRSAITPKFRSQRLQGLLALVEESEPSEYPELLKGLKVAMYDGTLQKEDFDLAFGGMGARASDEFAKSILADASFTKYHPNAIEGFITSMATQRPQEAVQLMSTLKPGGVYAVSENLLKALVQGVAESDDTIRIKLFDGAPDNLKYKCGSWAIMTELRQKGYAATYTDIASRNNSSSDPLTGAGIGGLATAAVELGTDAVQVCAKAAAQVKITGPTADFPQVFLAGAFSRKDWRESYNWAASLTPSAMRTSALGSALFEAAMRDTDAALSYAKNFPAQTSTEDKLNILYGLRDGFRQSKQINSKEEREDLVNQAQTLLDALKPPRQ